MTKQSRVADIQWWSDLLRLIPHWNESITNDYSADSSPSVKHLHSVWLCPINVSRMHCGTEQIDGRLNDWGVPSDTVPDNKNICVKDETSNWRRSTSILQLYWIETSQLSKGVTHGVDDQYVILLRKLIERYVSWYEFRWLLLQTRFQERLMRRYPFCKYRSSKRKRIEDDVKWRWWRQMS